MTVATSSWTPRYRAALDIDVYFTYYAGLDGAAGRVRTGGGPDRPGDQGSAVAAVPRHRAAAGLPRRRPGQGLGHRPRAELRPVQREAPRNRPASNCPRQWTIDEYRAHRTEADHRHTVGAYIVPDVARIALGPNYWYDGDRSNFGDPHLRARLPPRPGDDRRRVRVSVDRGARPAPGRLPAELVPGRGVPPLVDRALQPAVPVRLEEVPARLQGLVRADRRPSTVRTGTAAATTTSS